MIIPNRYSTQPVYFETEAFSATPFTPAVPFAAPRLLIRVLRVTSISFTL